jgi:hypothetical protein
MVACAEGYNVRNLFPEIMIVFWHGNWSVVSNHGRVLFLADDPGTRLQDMADRLRITERSAHGIVNDLTAAGYIGKRKDDRRNRDQIMARQPLPAPITREKIFREALALLPGAAAGQPPAEGDTAEPCRSFRTRQPSDRLLRLNLIGEPPWTPESRSIPAWISPSGPWAG